jgi:hypothetical protein
MIKHTYVYRGINTAMFIVTINISGNGEEIMHIVRWYCTKCLIVRTRFITSWPFTARREIIWRVLLSHATYHAPASGPLDMQGRAFTGPCRHTQDLGNYFSVCSNIDMRLTRTKYKYWQVIYICAAYCSRFRHSLFLRKQIDACIFSFSRTWCEEALWLRKWFLYFHGFTSFQSFAFYIVVSEMLCMSTSAYGFPPRYRLTGWTNFICFRYKTAYSI